jgi:hypothetical protein
MERIIRPGRTTDGNVFIRIEYSNGGQLSLTGVIGPTCNGNCKGSCGQIVDDLTDITEYAEGWGKAEVARLREYWNAWHLNDMTPNCPHQVGPEWDTSRKINLIGYQRTKEAGRLTSDAEAGKLSGRAYNKAKKVLFGLEKWHGESVNADAVPSEVSALVAAGYLEPWHWDHIEKTVTAGWTDATLGGILSRPCPVCGYKYGSAWLKREVPAEVVAWLFALPESDAVPAWV